MWTLEEIENFSQMTSMISEEVEMIKRVHSQMPPQLQQIIRIEGDKVTLVESEFFLCYHDGRWGCSIIEFWNLSLILCRMNILLTIFKFYRRLEVEHFSFFN